MKNTSISHEKEQGSTHVVVVALLVVALVGALGFIFWQNILQPKSDDKSVNKSDKAVSKSEDVKKDLEGKLVIKEWGVALKSPNASKLTYTYKKESGTSPLIGNSYDSWVMPMIREDYLDTKSCNDPGMIIYRSSEISQDSTSTNITKVGKYYFFTHGAPGLCPDGTDKDKALQSQILLEDLNPKNLVEL